MDNFEKKYNEALERARKIYSMIVNNEIIGFPEQIIEIFPVLRESEDERIRKKMVEHFKSKTKETWCDIPVKDILKWLEKKKYDRMKPVYDNQDSFESALEKAWKDYNDSGARTVDGCEDNYVECAHAKGFREGYLLGLEKQEQKPAECIEDSVKFEEGFKVGRESGLRDGQKYVLNNLDSYGLCKPAWSEEDEKMIDTIVSVLGQYIDYKAVSGTGSGYSTPRYIKEIVWLKSIRPCPSWKPSEEHLSALLAIFNDPDNIGSQTCQLALTDLYEQLKKLI